MSAYMVSKREIDLLVAELVAKNIVSPAEHTPTEIGRILWRENSRSINALYGAGSERAPSYTYSAPGRAYTDVAIFKIARHYRYQSCEHDGYQRSKAGRWIDALCLEVAIDVIHGLHEYDAAPWGI